MMKTNTFMGICLLLFFVSMSFSQQSITTVALRDRLLPAPLEGGFKMDSYWVWCGSVIKGEDGKYHMFASRWPKGLSFGPHWLTNSEIVHAVSEKPEGPYTFVAVALPPRGEQFWDGKMTHNPAIRKVGDTYLLYYTGTTYHGAMPTPEHPTSDTSALKLEAHRNERIGLATSKSVYGPWTRRDKPILDVRSNSWEQYLVSNPAPLVKEDGSILLYYKGVEKLRTHAIGLAVARTFEGPYERISDKPFEMGVGAEDPVMWFENGQYHALMLDCDRKYSSKEIYYATSPDGLIWSVASNPVAISKQVLWADGTIRSMASTERPWVLVENGQATHAFFATGDVKEGVRSTWNMCIPLKNESEVMDRMTWWREGRFGMFIHWGLYAIPAGIWNGKPIHDGRYVNPICEQIQWYEKILIKDYSPLAKQFNPVDFDADLIVRTAKAAEMKYITFTSKHHDGFAMYHTKVNKYNIVDATPYKKDPLAMLAKSCQREGIKLCVYYSLGRDWHNPNAVSKKEKRNYWDFPDTTGLSYQRYIDEQVKPQVQELLTQYGPLGVLWFDTPELTTLKQSIDLEMFVKRLQPDCIVNTRVGNEVGDYQEMEDNSVPMGGNHHAWETPATMAESWGYSVLDTKEYWKSSTELIRKLVEIASKGGNYLLNIGPDANGNIPPKTMQRLKDMQAWMKVNSEAIYGTEPAKLPALYGGCYTKKGNVLYVHLFEHPESGTLRLPVDGDSIIDVTMLTASGGKKLKFQATHGKGTLVQVPTSLPFKSVSVIKVSLR